MIRNVDGMTVWVEHIDGKAGVMMGIRCDLSP